MNKTAKIVVGIIILVLIVWLGYFYFKKPANNEPIKIGVILPLSGGAAALGENAKNGIEMALDNLDKKSKDFSIIFEDDQFNSQKAVSAFNKLVDADKVNYVITVGSNSSNAVAPIAEKNEIVHVAVSTDPKVLDYKFSIKNGSDPVELARVMANEAVRRNYQKIYVLSSNHEGVLSIINEFKNQESVKNRILESQVIDPNESDFRTILSKVKTSNADALLLEIIPGKVGVAAKQARELGINIPLFSAVVFEDQNAINAANGALENQWYINSSVSDDFINDYKDRFNQIPSREAGNGFDSIMLLSDAIGVVGNNPSDVNDYLHQLESFNSKSINGGVVAQNGNFINFAVVKIIKNGQFVKYE